MASDDITPNNNTPEANDKPDKPDKPDSTPSASSPSDDFSFKTAEHPQPKPSSAGDQGDEVSLNPQPLPPKENTSPSGSVRNRKKLYIIGAIVLVVVAVVVAAWFYYNNSKKVLADALTKTISAESGSVDGKAEFNSKDQTAPVKIAVDFSGSQNNEIGQVNAKAKISFGALDFNTDLSFISAKNEAYFKVNNAKQLTQLASGFTGGNADMAKAFDGLAQKIDNKWIKIDQQGQEVNKCSEALTEANLSSGDQKSLKKLFESNQFVKAKNAGGSNLSEIHYSLSFDKAAGEKFLDEAMKLDSFKKIKEACDTESMANDLKNSTSSDNQNQTVKAELWVNRWSHKPTKVMLSVEDKEAKMTLTSNINLGAKVSVSKPTGAQPLSEVTKQFQTDFLKALQNQQSNAQKQNSTQMNQAEIDQLLNSAIKQ